jgi:ribosomal protein S11
MFRTRKAKIVSQTPILEASLDSKKQNLVGIDSVVVEGSLSWMTYGTITDYSGKEYDFEWDNSTGKLARLTGSQVTPTLWSDAVELLKEKLVQKETEEQLEIEDIEISVEEAIQKALEPVLQKLQSLETKIENIKVQSPAPTPTPAPKAQKPKFVEEEQLPQDEELTLDDFSGNALKFLQETGGNDIDVDYLSL